MPNNTKKPFILCVDDEKIVLDTLNRQLQRFYKDEYEFEVSESADEALAIIDEMTAKGHPFVMIITDQIMPNMAGDALLTQLHQSYPSTVKIMLTGQASLDSAINSINNASLYRYLSKPWSEHDLLFTVEKGIEQFFLKDKILKQNDLFRKFFPAEFLQCLAKETVLDVSLGDHVLREMSILFSDIRNFTSLSEMLTPEETYTFINRYLKYTEPAIHKNHGVIDKYIGDAILAIFHKPEDALKAALDTQTAIAQFNKDFQHEKYCPISSGIGLHTGSLMLGIVGVDTRLQCTVIADAVNLASRMQSLATSVGGLIMASGTFISKLQNYDSSNLRYLGKVFVKGKKEINPVYEIISRENDSHAQEKIDTKEDFLTGINLFFDKKFVEACVKFKQVLDYNPSDKCALRYLNLAAKWMLDGANKELEGIYLTDMEFDSSKLQEAKLKTHAKAA